MLSDKEVLDLFHAPNPNKTKDLLRQIANYALIVLGFVVLIIIILYRNKRVLKRQKEQLELKTRISQLELQVVKTQMNPHFISNSLAAIQELIYTHQTEKAGHYVAKFSFFLRQVLKYSDKNFITLAEELDIIRLNVDLEQLRFKNQFDFNIQIHEGIDMENISIPALITQPLIENAIWHGLLPLDGSRLPSLKITASIKNNIPYLEITDNGIGRKSASSAQHQSKGTQLIIDKIESLNRLSEGNHYKLLIEDLKDADENPIGTKVTIELNAKTDE